MKANAPEKIYLEAIYPDNGVLPNGLNYTPSPTDIEYIRKDAFIEKALKFLDEKFYFNNLHYSIESGLFNSKEEMFEKFKKYVED